MTGAPHDCYSFLASRPPRLRTPGRHRFLVEEVFRRIESWHGVGVSAAAPATPPASATPRAAAGDDLLTLSEVARLLRVSESQAWVLVNRGRLPHVNVGVGKVRRQIRVRRIDLDTFTQPICQPAPIAPSRAGSFPIAGPSYF